MRINCVPVDYLSDRHLFSAWREIKMLPKALLRSIESKKGLDKTKISPVYTLNTGHGYFFYNKLGYIYKQFDQLRKELENRGYNINSFEITRLDIPELMNDWVPTKQDQLVSLERIRLRIMDKPEWYQYKSKKMTKEDWISFLDLQQEMIKGE